MKRACELRTLLWRWRRPPNGLVRLRPCDETSSGRGGPHPAIGNTPRRHFVTCDLATMGLDEVAIPFAEAVPFQRDAPAIDRVVA